MEHGREKKGVVSSFSSRKSHKDKITESKLDLQETQGESTRSWGRKGKSQLALPKARLTLPHLRRGVKKKSAALMQVTLRGDRVPLN